MEEIEDKEIPAFSPLPQQDADALLAKEMAAMSVQEREKSLNDIHGVSDVMDEEPSFVRAKMEEMETELSKLTSNKGKEAYMQAEAQNKEYVTCDKFLLKFLRAEMFNARLAAGTMVRFFDEKKKLFGPEKLTKEIKLWDLDKDDQTFLQSGVNQILPQRDRAGRRIITSMPRDSNWEREEMNTRVRSSWWTDLVFAKLKMLPTPAVCCEIVACSLYSPILSFTHREEDEDFVLSTNGC
jgi:predicted Mrr-cat superfamily restriction endonuclease